MSDELDPQALELARESGLTVQPNPQANDLPSAHDLGIDYLRGDLRLELEDPETLLRLRKVRHLLEELARLCGKDAEEELARRKEFGLKKYGTLLQPFNGRDHLADALDEAMDLYVYLLAAAYEESKG